MNSDFDWQLPNKLRFLGRTCDCAFQNSNVNVFSRVTRGIGVVPDVVDVDGSVEGQGDHLRHLSHLEIA